MSSANEIVLSGMSTGKLCRMLDSYKAKLEQRKRQADKLFTLHATATTDEDSTDYYNLFELVVREINAYESNVDMFQSALTRRVNKYNAARTRMADTSGSRVTKISK